MKRTFFSRYSLLILCLVFFLAPLSLRGARMAMQRMTNRVQDWLPSDFEETSDLAWFAQHFMGEQFVIVTWPGCSDEDPRYHKLVEKLRGELAPPSVHAGAGPGSTEADPIRPFGELAGDELAEVERLRAREVGDSLGLSTTGDDHADWGDRGEKWLLGDKELWYFITPEGELYRWDGRSNMMGYLKRQIQRNLFGHRRVDGELVATVGQPSTPQQPNEFHADPRKITARLFQSILTGPETLEQLSRKDGPLWPRGVDDDFAAKEALDKALERLTGTLMGPDGEQTCIVLTLSEPGKRDLRRVIGRPLLGKPRGRLLDIAMNECGIGEEELKLGGPPVDNVAIDEEGQITLARLIAYSAIVGIGLSLLLVRSVKITVMLFIIGGLSALNSLAIVFWTGGTVDAIMMSMPSLVYVLGMSGALHLVNYYREVVHEEGLVGAPEKMLKLGWRASILCATTTSIGLLSLVTSNLVPIRNFGIYSAIGVMCTVLLFYTYLPAALQTWPPRAPKKPAFGNAPSPFEIRMQGVMAACAAFFVRRWALVGTACLAVILFCFLGVFRIHTSVHLIKFFDRDAKIIRDYAWLEEHLARLVPMELVLRVSPEMMRSTVPAEEGGDQPAEKSDEEQRFQLDFLERMEATARIQQVVEREFGESGQDIVGRGMSVPTFAPELPPPGFSTIRNPVRWATSRQLEEHRGEFLASDYLRVDRQEEHQGSELWRVSLRLAALQEIDYGRFVGELKRVVEPVLHAYRYREQILRELANREGNPGIIKARVAFLGLPDPSQPGGAGADGDAADDLPARTAAAGSSRGDSDAEIDQTRIFAETLQNLMICAGVYAKKGSWHDPQSAQVDSDFYTSATWGDVLAKKFDCVVLVADDPAYDLDFIRQHAGLLVDAREHTFDPAAPQAQTAAQRDESMQVIYTGVVPLVYKAQRSLLDSLIQSTLWSFVTITPLMMILSRSIPAGIVIMLPNVLPVVVVFGGLGWLGVDVDVGSMMTASIALGVAVDDTIHFLHWYRDDLDRLQDRKLAIVAAYRRCGVPTLQAACISGLGLSVFAFSTFTPTQRFGYLMLSILIAGVVAELVMLPAILASPLGRFYKPRKHKSPTPAAVEPAGESLSAANAMSIVHVHPSHRDKKIKAEKI